MKRIIVKIGTGVLSRIDGTLDDVFLATLVDQIVVMRRSGAQVVIVTSGAVGAGRSMLQFAEDRSAPVHKQVYAAVGQVKLMSTYAEFFSQHGYYCAQVLATKEDFRDDEHYQNMQNCFESLLLDNVIPIVNENDVVATTELLFTDNDELAGLVARQINADTLVILTGTDGVLDDHKKTISEVTLENSDSVMRYVSPDTSTGGRGGMISKFKVATELTAGGTEVWIVNGRLPGVLDDVTSGKSTGTRFRVRV